MTVANWWKDAVGYQIYPRSFADFNGDGTGDLLGIIEKLDYLQWLGVTALWISPCFPSPQFDVGYDVSDYTAINPEYGTMADFDRFLAGAHQRGIRVLLDFVLNHTSDQHHWFLESKSSRDNPKRDWYIWRDAKPDGSPPNDWEATFGGSAWEWDAATEQYYYHFFFKQQPDLNWRNPEVQEAMFNVMRFWFDKGVDGFRLDAIGTIFENPELPDCDYPVPVADLMRDLFLHRGDRDIQTQFKHKFIYQRDLPETYELMKKLRAVCDEYPDRVLLGETDNVSFYGAGADMLHSVCNFQLMNIATLAPEKIRQMFTVRLPTIPDGAWESNSLGNHDRNRAMETFGSGGDRNKMEVALALCMFLRGTPLFYYGEEIGMRRIDLPDLESFRDNLGVWAYDILIEEGISPDEALHVANQVGRDECRTPMQWDDTPNAGFAPKWVQTWLPVNPDFQQGINVAAQRDDEHSLLNFFRRLVQIRQSSVALKQGEMEILSDTGDVLAFWRKHAEETCLVLLNMSDLPQSVHLNESLETVFSRTGQGNPSALPPYEIYVGRLR